MALRIVVAASVLAVSSVMPSQGQAAIRHQIDIPAQSLGAALASLARQTRIQVVYSAQLVEGKQSFALSGSMTPEEALDKLLATTLLKYEFIDPHTVTLSTPSERTGRWQETSGSGFSGPLSRLAQAETQLPVTNVAASPVAAESRSLEEIVVTAQKRAENLQDVPISIAVVSGDRLDRSSFDGVREVLTTVPGVSITTNQNMSPTITIRGVGATVARLGGAGVIGYYVDSVPYAMVKHALIPDTSAYDLDRVEVLRGPQGTLYGASSLNGVVRVLTKDADPSRFELKARGLTSTTNDGGMNYRGDAAINVPIVQDKLAARVSLSYQDMGGWIDRIGRDDANASESTSARLKINATPTDELSIGASAWISRIDNDGTNVADDNGFLPIARDQPNEDGYDSYGLRIAYDFPAFTLSSMTSYIESEVQSNLDVNLYGFPNQVLSSRFESESFSEELLLTSTPGGNWRWTAGAMYRDAKDTSFQFQGPPNAILNNQDDTSESISVFGELTRLFFDGKFEVTGGLRYFEDEVGIDDRLQAGTNVSRTANFDNVAPRVVLTWHPSGDLTTYASYSEGFRSGSHQLGSAARAGLPAVKPDTLTNYELGMKGNAFDGLLSFDAAVYYIDWQDVQRQVAIPVVVNGLLTFPFALVNGDSASGPGFDLGVTLRPFDRLTLGASVSYNELTLDTDVVSQTAAGNILVAKKGDRLQSSPELTAGASVAYGFPIGAWEGQLALAANYVSKNPDYQYNPIIQTYSHDSILIGRVGLSIRSESHWAASLFVDNVNNEDGRVFQPGVSPVATTGPVALNYTRPRPRTVGVQVEYQF